MVAGCDTPVGSAPAALTPIPSPSGAYTLVPSVNQSKADPTSFGCVNFDLLDGQTIVVQKAPTGASDFQRWALGWHDETTIVLHSSDIGVRAWKLADEKLTEIPSPLPPGLIDAAGRLRDQKYPP